jgi:hypothetical protein
MLRALITWTRKTEHSLPYVFRVTWPAVERRYARKFPLLLACRAVAVRRRERGEGKGEESNMQMRWFWLGEQPKNNPLS